MADNVLVPSPKHLAVFKLPCYAEGEVNKSHRWISQVCTMVNGSGMFTQCAITAQRPQGKGVCTIDSIGNYSHVDETRENGPSGHERGMFWHLCNFAFAQMIVLKIRSCPGCIKEHQRKKPHRINRRA